MYGPWLYFLMPTGKRQVCVCLHHALSGYLLNVTSIFLQYLCVSQFLLLPKATMRRICYGITASIKISIPHMLLHVEKYL